MKRCIALSVVVAYLFLVGCASKLMDPASTSEIRPAPEDKAQIVFMRSSFVASAIGAEMFEINDGELKLVGGLQNDTKIAYLTEPGEKVFMAYGHAADFMIADVEAGMTYYSIVRPNWGTGGFAPTPVRKRATEYSMQSEEFPDWLNGTRLVTKRPTADAWFEENRGKYEEIYERYWPRFQEKSPEEKRQRTLMAPDGVNKPVSGAM